MDLFTPIVKEKRLHPLFKRVIQDKTYQPAIAVINEWSNGLLGRKGESEKFIKEFQTTFNSSLWELYLNKSFLELGFDIDYSKESPDFNLTHPSGRHVCVEAVTANNQLNESDEYYTTKSFSESIHTDNGDFLDKSTIKLIGKLKDKKSLFIGANDKKHPYSSLEHVKGNPFVVAVAPFDNHLSFTQNNMAINRVLYGINPPKGNSISEMVSEKITHIMNHNDNRIELGIFTNDSYKEISAVIFSTTGMFGKAVVQSGISNFIRATKYRQMERSVFLEKEGIEKLGTSHTQLGKGNDLFTMRFPSGDYICGSDMHLYHSSKHQESHLDGLHIYYNPFAEVPLDKDLFSAYELTQNDYDTENEEMISIHNDGSLVSRQTYTSFS
ncbi:hypothetical protein [Vibrio splendidus]|uniref:hypothetical protein n=1 Tax=Vibrio splendidus TaxID=29497 RepID=UPI000E08E9BA|nr:hypothetical protein [Vibrio splendidus]